VVGRGAEPQVRSAGAGAGARAGGGGGHLQRDFTLGSTFSLAFAFISPIVALYAIFGLGLASAGPSFWWAFPVVLVGQLLVALTLGELSSRWPVQGGLFPWSTRLVGPRYGWATGWTYVWTLTTLAIAGAYAASTFAASLVGLEDPSVGVRLLLALALLAVATVVNAVGRGLLKVFVVASIACEVVGSLAIGTVLLVTHRENDLSVVLDGFSSGGGSFALGPFLVAVALVGWAFIGFEAAADVAEEVTDPARAVPRAMIASLVLVALTVMYAGLALVLAVPDLPAAVSGELGDPIAATLEAQLGAAVVRPMMLVVCIGFTAGLVAIGTAVSRVVHAMARDGQLPAARVLGRLSRRDGVPVPALLVTSALAAVLLVLAVVTGLYDTLIAMSTGGFYIAFALPVLRLLVARARGRWTPGPFSLGALGSPVVNAVAAAWLVFQVINIAWPRDLGAPWYVEWGCVLVFAVVAALGAAVHRGLPEPAVEDSTPAARVPAPAAAPGGTSAVAPVAGAHR